MPLAAFAVPPNTTSTSAASRLVSMIDTCSLVRDPIHFYAMTTALELNSINHRGKKNIHRTLRKSLKSPKSILLLFSPMTFFPSSWIYAKMSQNWNKFARARNNKTKFISGDFAINQTRSTPEGVKDTVRNTVYSAYSGLEIGKLRSGVV